MTRPQRDSRDLIAQFLLLICVLTGASILLGKTPAPGSIDSQLSPAAVKLWAGALTLGALLALVGIWWRRPIDPRRITVTGVVLEQLGLVMTGLATLFYAAGAVVAVGPSALQPVSLHFGFGVVCLVEAHKLQRLLRGVEGVDR